MEKSGFSLSLQPSPSQLPVFVTENLLSTSLSDRADSQRQHESVGLNEGGWIWMVTNRQVHVWNYRAPSPAPCFELPLSPSGLKYSAPLISVYSQTPTGAGGKGAPGVVAVSPEGMIRHWGNAAHSKSFSETPIELPGGQVAHSLTRITDCQFVLATTTCGLFILRAPNSTKQDSMGVTVYPLQTSRGMMAGLSRRVSSIIFSSQTHKEARLISIATPLKSASGPVPLAGIVTPEFVQVWKLKAGPSPLQWDTDLKKLMAVSMMELVWDLRTPQSQANFQQLVKTWLIDMVAYRNGALLLFAAANVAVSKEIKLAIAYCPSIDFAISEFEWISSFDMKKRYTMEREEEVYGFKLISPDAGTIASGLSVGVFVLGPGTLTGIRLSDAIRDNRQLVADEIHWCGDDSLETDHCLGSGSDGTHCYLFLRDAGLVISKLIPVGSDNVGGSSLGMEKMDESSDNAGSPEHDLTIPFLLFAKGRLTEASEKVEELLKLGQRVGGPDMSAMVARLFLEILDDFPVADPRWAKASVSGKKLGGRSLVILYQLEDKKKTLDIVVNFLKTFALWDKLGPVRMGAIEYPSAHGFILEALEKLEACIALQSSYQDGLPIIFQKAIIASLRQRRETEIGKELTEEDLFFRKVSAFHDVFGFIKTSAEEALGKPNDEAREMEFSHVNEAVLVCLRAITKFRLSGLRIPGSQNQRNPRWTQIHSVHPPLRQLFELSVKLLRSTGENNIRGTLAAQAVEYADFLISDTDEQERGALCRTLLSILIEANEIDRAIHLGEKYQSFPSLVEAAEKGLRPEMAEQMIEEWKIKFANEGFRGFLYDWYLKKGKVGKLLGETSGGPGQDLDHFLEGHDELAWIHSVDQNNYRTAAETLYNLAFTESRSAEKKQGYLSMARISLMADMPPVQLSDRERSIPDPDEREKLLEIKQERIYEELEQRPLTKAVDRGLRLLEFQHELPESALRNLGVALQNPPPLSAEQMIQALLDDRSYGSAELFIGLGILHWLFEAGSEQEGFTDLFDSLLPDFWIESIVRNEWTRILTSVDPTDAAQQTIFAKMMESTSEFRNGSDLIYPMEKLLKDERLGDWNQDSTFKYLLRIQEEKARRRLREGSEGDVSSAGSSDIMEIA